MKRLLDERRLNFKKSSSKQNLTREYIQITQPSLLSLSLVSVVPGQDGESHKPIIEQVQNGHLDEHEKQKQAQKTQI